MSGDPGAVDVPVLSLGAPPGDHLAIRPIGRAASESEDFWEGNWLATGIEVVAGAFRGRVEAALRPDDFSAFREQLEALRDGRLPQAVFQTPEGWLAIRVTAAAAGRLAARCEVTDDPGFGATLRFELEVAASDLPGWLGALDEIGRRFPLVGDPGEGGPEGMEGEVR